MAKAVPSSEEIQGTPFEYEGVPFVGQPFLFKDSDPDYLKPQMRSAHRLEVLRSWEDPDRRRYEQIYNLIASGKAQLFYEERHFDEKKSGWLMLLSWTELYSEAPVDRQHRPTAVIPVGEKEAPDSEPGNSREQMDM